MVEAAARDELIRKRVKFGICSCSRADDEWQEVLERYSTNIESAGLIEKNAVRLHSLKFHREHYLLCKRLRKQLRRKDLIMQCEQGADLFVGPLSNKLLQDNDEDHLVHHICMGSAQRARAGVAATDKRRPGFAPGHPPHLRQHQLIPRLFAVQMRSANR